MLPIDPDSVLAKPPEARRRMRFRKKRRYTKRTPRSFSREELLEFLRKHNIRSWHGLLKSDIPNKPQPYDYHKEFGLWSKAKEEAFGRDVIDKAGFDGVYTVWAILTYELWTREKYRERARMYPGELPSEYKVQKEWKQWRNIAEVAKRNCTLQVVNEYMRLWRRLGRKPTAIECRTAKLDITKAVKFYTSKETMDKMVSLMMGVKI